MYHITERNERNARTTALVLAIGLHFSLGFLLYSQMSEPSTTRIEKKTNVSKERSGAVAVIANQP